MIAGGRVPAGEAGPMHVHQGGEIPRVLSGQILIRCRDRRRTTRLVRRAPLPGNPAWFGDGLLRRAQPLRRHISWASAVLLWLAGAYIVYYWLTAIRLS